MQIPALPNIISSITREMLFAKRSVRNIQTRCVGTYFFCLKINHSNAIIEFLLNIMLYDINEHRSWKVVV